MHLHTHTPLFFIRSPTVPHPHLSHHRYPPPHIIIATISLTCRRSAAKSTPSTRNAPFRATHGTRDSSSPALVSKTVNRVRLALWTPDGVLVQREVHVFPIACCACVLSLGRYTCKQCCQSSLASSFIVIHHWRHHSCFFS